MQGKPQTTLFENGMLWFGTGLSIAEILTGTYFAPMGWRTVELAVAQDMNSPFRTRVPSSLGILSEDFQIFLVGIDMCFSPPGIFTKDTEPTEISHKAGDSIVRQM